MDNGYMSTLLNGHKAAPAETVVPQPSSPPPGAAAGSKTFKATTNSRFETPEQKVMRQQSFFDTMPR